MCGVEQQCLRDELRKKRSLDPDFFQFHTISEDTLNVISAYISYISQQSRNIDDTWDQIHIPVELPPILPPYHLRTVLVGNFEDITALINDAWINACPVYTADFCEFTIDFPSVVTFAYHPLFPLRHAQMPSDDPTAMRVTLRAYHYNPETGEPVIRFVYAARPLNLNQPGQNQSQPGHASNQNQSGPNQRQPGHSTNQTQPEHAPNQRQPTPNAQLGAGNSEIFAVDDEQPGPSGLFQVIIY